VTVRRLAGQLRARSCQDGDGLTRDHRLTLASIRYRRFVLGEDAEHHTRDGCAPEMLLLNARFADFQAML
jgi:hypothetical protein